MSKNRCDLLYQLMEPIVTNKGMELVDVEFVKEGTNRYLRLFIDKEGGVALEDCEQISKEISTFLDKEDPIKQTYILEVSSPGLDRPLKRDKDFQKHQGYKVIVKTYTPFNGKKKFCGKLGTYHPSNLILHLDDKQELVIPWQIVSQVKLDWEEEGRRKS